MIDLLHRAKKMLLLDEPIAAYYADWEIKEVIECLLDETFHWSSNDLDTEVIGG